MSDLKITKPEKPTVFENLAALVNDQRSRVPDSAEGWQELVSKADDLRDKANFVQDNDLGKYIFGFLSDPKSVKRRVEKITIFNEGQTRRALSFDIELPYEKKAIHGDQVYVPLTMLRKGMLTDFDSTNEAGEPIPNLGFMDNGRLAWQGIAHAADHTVLTGIFDDFEDCNLTEQERKDILYTGIAHVQLSWGCDETAMDEEVVYRSQEVSRHNIFSFLAQLCMYLDCKHFDGVDNLVYFPWLESTNLAVPDVYVQEIPLEQEVLDSDPSVQLLMVAILRRAYECATGGDNSDELKALEMLCILLAVASFAYLLVPLLDKSSCFVEDADGKIHSRRTLVKISANVEINFEGETAQVISMDETPKFLMQAWDFLKSCVIPYSTVNVSYSVLSASSTHLEFFTPANTHVRHHRGIVAANPRLEYLATGPMSTDYPVRRVVNCSKEPRVTRERERNEAREEVDFSREKPSTQRRDRHGSYRVSQSAVHVQSTSSGRTQALEYLRLRLCPDWKNQYFWAAFTAIASVLLTNWVAGFAGAGIPKDKRALDISIDTLIAVVTLITAIYGALLLTSSGHYLVRRTFRVPILFTGFSGLVATLTPFILLWEEGAKSFVKIFRWHWANLAWLGAVIVLVAAFALWQICRLPDDDFGLEKLIPEQTRERKRFQDRSLVAVTETGNLDCDYLHDEIVYWAKTRGKVDPEKTHKCLADHLNELRDAVKKVGN